MTDASVSLTLTVLSWNIEGLKNHIHYLTERLIEDSVDMAFLSEPQLFQHNLEDTMIGLKNQYCYFLNSEDLIDLDLPLIKSHSKGGTMVVWKKWLDPYIIAPSQPVSSSFQPVILTLPSCPVSIHISVYLPTSGKDMEYSSALTDLQACIDNLLEVYPDALIYLRGDFNTNRNNLNRCRQLAAFMKVLKVIPVDISHKTYHHFVGNGRFDSDIDLIMHSKNASTCETVTQIWCKLNEPEINSHHDVIISK